MRFSLLLCLALAAMCLPARARVWYVNQNSPGPAHDGSSWASGFVHVADGLAAAASGDEVWVGAGTYTENLVLEPGVAMYGGFVGFESLRRQRYGLPSLTVLDGGMNGPVINVVSGGSGNATVDGFTIRNGTVGLLMAFASPVISHNVITMNGPGSQASGGIYCETGSPTITDNVISQNVSVFPVGASGSGAIYCGGAPTIANNTVAGNTGLGTKAFGGITCSATAKILNNIVAFNTNGIVLLRPGASNVRNNCIYDNADESYLGVLDFIGQNGNISVDPKFASFAYGNLHIQPDSPCRDAGDSAVVADGDTDIDLLPRVVGPSVDIGADESDGRIWFVQPAVVRVSPIGSDANDGSSWALAKATIQSAVNEAAVTGGEVWVAAGVYPAPAPATGTSGGFMLPANVYLYGGFDGSETEWSQRDPAANATFLGGNGKGPVVTATTGYRVSAVDGFVITKDGRSGNAVGGIYAPTASPMITNNVFTGNVVGVSCGNGFAYVADNSFLGASSNAITGGSVFITRNLFEGNSGGPTVSLGLGCVLTNNLFRYNTVSIGGQYINGNGQPLVVNNTFIGNHTSTFLVTGTQMSVKFVNNIVAYNTGTLTLAPISSIRNNCFYENGSVPAAVGTYGNFNANPGFVNYGHDDDHLAANSPCIDAGDDSLVAPGDLDFEGNPRSQGHHVDIGAYESAAVSGQTTYPDLLGALRRAGGLVPSSVGDAYLNVQDAGGSHGVIDLSDAGTLARRNAGAGAP